MSTGYKYGSNNTDISTLIPAFPEGTNSTILEFSGTDTIEGIKYLAKNSVDPWLTEKDIANYIGDYYKTHNVYKMVDPASRPTFRTKCFEFKGNWPSTYTDGEWKYVRFRRDGSGLHCTIYNQSWSGVDWQSKYFTDSAGNAIVPTKVIVVMQAAGGQGCMGDSDREGAGGGGGGSCCFIVDVPLGSDAQNYIELKIPGGCCYNTADYRTDGRNGNNATLTTPNGSTAIAYGGKGADWDGLGVIGEYTKAKGGDGGSGSINNNGDIWPLRTGLFTDITGVVSGCKGGNGDQSGHKGLPSPGGNSGVHDLCSTEIYPRPSSYRLEYLSYHGGQWRQWGGGGGASMMGYGGDGAKRNEDGYRHGQIPEWGYGGGGGGGRERNWGGASAPGYIAIYF